MKTLLRILLLSVLIFAITIKRDLLSIILSILFIYTIIELIIQIINSSNSLKFKFFQSNYSQAGNPLVFFNTNVKVDKVEKFMKEYNKKNPEKKINFEVMVLRGLGNSFHENKCYGNISFGCFTNLDNVDITIIKNYEGREIYQTVRNVNHRKISDLNEEIVKNKNLLIEDFDKNKKNFDSFSKYLPGFLVKLYLQIFHFFSYSVKINFFDYQKNNFGNAILFSTMEKGSFRKLYLPMTKRINSAVILIMNEIQEVVFYKENGEIGIERMFKFSLTADHRNGDAHNLSDLVTNFKKVFENPEQYI